MRLVCAQLDVVFGDPAANMLVARQAMEANADADFIVFPEAFLTGYCVDSLAEAEAIAVPFSTACSLQEDVDRMGQTVVIGFLERDGDSLYNTAALLEPNVAPRRYRKTHLPCMGIDRFVKAGDELPVFETRFGKVGILICFDQRPPEATRSLALRGIDLLVLPTNWPEGAETSAEYMPSARAAENKIFVATCNRAGSEAGFNFIGRSKIVAPTGHIIASADRAAGFISADLDLALARQKRTVNVPGKYEIDIIGCRRPELY